MADPPPSPSFDPSPPPPSNARMHEGWAPMSVIGSGTWGPVTPPIAIRPPHMTWNERVLHRLGRTLYAIAHPLERLGEAMTTRAAARVNEIARKEIEAVFGAPGARIV